MPHKKGHKNKSVVALTPAQKAELKQAQQDTFAKAKLAALNENRAATESRIYAAQQAQNVGSIGMAAAAGGKFVDTSEAPGYNGSVTTGAFTKLLMGNVKDPFIAAQQAAVQNRVKRTSKKSKKTLFELMAADYRSGIKDVKAGGGSGTSTIGYTAQTAAGPAKTFTV